jgi:DNA invertase Pin-like site-specific DNA recombinase
MFGLLGVFAEFERALIQERIRAGLARARAAGRALGRPRVQVDAAAVRGSVEGGLSIRKAAALHG